jgi:hypothetical protein
MEIQGAFVNDKLPSRFKQPLVASFKWIVTGALIVWIIFCLAVSVLTFLADILPTADAVVVGAIENNPVYLFPTR